MTGIRYEYTTWPSMEVFTVEESFLHSLAGFCFVLRERCFFMQCECCSQEYYAILAQGILSVISAGLRTPWTGILKTGGFEKQQSISSLISLVKALYIKPFPFGLVHEMQYVGWADSNVSLIRWVLWFLHTSKFIFLKCHICRFHKDQMFSVSYFHSSRRGRARAHTSTYK